MAEWLGAEWRHRCQDWTGAELRDTDTVSGHRVSWWRLASGEYRVTVDDWWLECPDEGYPDHWAETLFDGARWSLMLPAGHCHSWPSERWRWHRERGERMTERGDWHATHAVLAERGEVLAVMLDDGRAYTLSEWQQSEAADLEVSGGEWLRLGEPLTGRVLALDDDTAAVVSALAADCESWREAYWSARDAVNDAVARLARAEMQLDEAPR